MLDRARGGRIRGLIVVLLFATSAAWADTLVQVTSQAGQGANDSIGWKQLGGDQKLLLASFSAKSGAGTTHTVTLAGANSVVSVVCSTTPSNCSWTGGTGFATGDSLIWTSDAGNGGNGPVKLTFGTPMAGAGALIQANIPGQFTAKIEAFNGATSLGAFTVTSDKNGDAAYIGLKDQTAANITSVIFSLTSCAATCTDFGIDTAYLNVGAPGVKLSPTTLTFAAQLLQTTSAAKQVSLTNTGSTTLDITSLSVSGNFAQSNACGSSLTPGKSCTISVTFKPTAIGTRSGSLTIADNAKGSPQSVGLSGTGTEVKLSATSLNFGNQPVNTKSSTKTVTMTNVGTATMSITGITINGTDPGDFAESKTCGTSLGAGKSCTISATFTPKAKGSRQADLSISDSGGASPQIVTLLGTGT
jgi:archaellum component FlaF (FlaF/FlaG flagellin family)